MKKTIEKITVLILMLFMVCGFSQTVLAFSGSGGGTVSNPYIITEPAQLQEINDSLGSHYKLGNDLNMTGINHKMIADWRQPFTGTFDGAGFKIENLTNEYAPGYSSGLFGYIDKTSNPTEIAVKNLELKNVKLEGYDVAAIAVSIKKGGISNCKVSGTLTAHEISASMIGRAGGLVSVVGGDRNDTFKVDNCSFTGTIKGIAQEYSGLIGSSVIGLDIRNSYAIADIITEQFDVGNTREAKVVSGLANADTPYGYLYVDQCYFAGTIRQKDPNGKIAYMEVSGLISGLHTSTTPPTLKDSFVAADIMKDTNYNVHYYNKPSGINGSVTEINVKNSYIGGYLPTNNTSRTEAYAFGEKTIQTNSYFDVTKNPKATFTTGSSKTTAQMYQKATYVGWDFNNIWAIDQGTNYPYLKNLKNPYEPQLVLSKPSISLASKTENEIVLNWGTIGNADYYEVDYNGTIKTFTTAPATITGLTPSTAYTIKVRACTSEVESDWSSDLVVTTDAPIVPALDLNVGNITYVKATDTTIKIKWNNAVDASSYEVSYNGTIETTNTNEIIITGLTADTEYILKVRGCAGAETGNWSSSLTVETSSAPSTPPPSSSSNLALSGVATSDSETNNYKADKAIDDDQTTRWLSAIGATNCYVEIDLGSMKTFNQIKINEFGARIKDYDIAVWDGSSWITVESGTGIGASFETSFSDVTGSKVRLLINTTYSTRPSISEIEIYNN